MNWWLDLGRVYCYEIIGQKDLLNPEKIINHLNKKASTLNVKVKKNPYHLIISKTLLNNFVINNVSEEESKNRIRELFKNNTEKAEVHCSFCSRMTTKEKESIASRKWIISGGRDESPLFAGGGLIPPRICLNCRRLSLLASFKAYELFIENKLPFIIYNPKIEIYKTLLDNLITRRDLNLHFEEASSVFLSLGSMLVCPNFSREGNISGVDFRPILPKVSRLLINLTGVLRKKEMEQYILELIEKTKERLGDRLIADYFRKGESKLPISEVTKVFFTFVKVYKGGIGMTKEFFNLGKELGEMLGDKAYSVVLKLYKSTKNPTQFQKQLMGVYIYLREPIPVKLTQITENEENALAFIMGIMNTIEKEGKDEGIDINNGR